MGAERGRPAGDRLTGDGWRLRIRGRDGRSILGAGIFVGKDTALTCAHVVGGRDGTVLVDFVGVPGAPPVPARVADQGWFPERGEGFGDVALLRLDGPVPGPGAVSAPLRRLAPLTDRRVRMCGFPAHRDPGVWFRATTVGPHGEWVQMAPTGSAETVRPGFSGAGVVTIDGGHVIGMVVSRYVDPSRAPSGGRFHADYMIPVETLVRYLPRIERWVGGDRAVDGTLVPRAPHGSGTPSGPGGDTGFGRRLTAWLRREGMPDVWTAVVTPYDTGRAATLRQAISSAARELSHYGADGTDHEDDAHGTDDGDRSRPPVGSLDLAVDVAGRTVEEVAQRFADRAGLPVTGDAPPVDRIFAGRMPPLTAVVEGIDMARDPSALAELLGLLAARGNRLLLVFRRPGTAAQRRLEEITGGASQATARLDRLGERLAGLVRLELTARRLALLFPYVRPAGPVPDRAVSLRVDLTLLRHDPDPDGPDFPRRLADAELATAAALSRAERYLEPFAGPRRRRDELRGLLDAARHRLAEGGRAEDPDAAALHRVAHEALHTPPCDLAAAAPAVDRFVQAVRDVLNAEPLDTDPLDTDALNTDVLSAEARDTSVPWDTWDTWDSREERR